MENIMKELDAAYAILSSMLVSHENVQKLAAAEIKLQHAYAELKALAQAQAQQAVESEKDKPET